MALGGSLLTAGNAGIRNVNTEDFGAYDIYLQALEQQNINTEEDFLGGLEWFRQAIIADPDNPNHVARIAGISYDVGLVSQGDLWFDRLRSEFPERVDLYSRLDIKAADASQDQDRLLEVLHRDVTRVLNGEVDFFLPTIYYPAVMGAHGRPQETLDYLTELIPGLQNYSKLVEGKTAQYMQFISFGLQRYLMDREDFQELAQTLVRAIDGVLPDWREGPKMNEIIVEIWLGNFDKAKQVLMDAHSDWPRVSGQWLQLRIYPWLEELRSDPEVAAIIATHEQQKAQAADQLREMLKQPEWN